MSCTIKCLNAARNILSIYRKINFLFISGLGLVDGSCNAQAFYRAGSYANDSAKRGAGLELLKKIQIIPRAPHSHGEISVLQHC